MISELNSRHRLWAVLVLILFLGGCSNLGGDAGSLASFVKMRWDRPADISYDEAAAVPYASIGLRLDDGPQIMLVLASDHDGQQLWTSAERVAVAVREGRIARTAGFGADLGHLAIQQRGSGTLDLVADFPRLNAYNIAIHCIIENKGSESIMILGHSLTVTRESELCRAQSLGWRFENTFWRDTKSGAVWRARQYVNPKLGPIEIEIFRPPS